MNGKHFVMLFVCVCAGMMVYSGWELYDQHAKISSFQPVEATIVSAEIKIETGTGKQANTLYYWPDIEYEYEVDAQLYRCERVYPADFSMSEKRAERIVEMNRPGQRATAYYDPDDPQEAFLIRQYRYTPALMAQIGLVLIMVLLYGVLWRKVPGSRPPEPLAVGDGWYQLSAKEGKLSEKRRRWGILTLVWLGVWCATSGHYLWFAARPYGTLVIVSSIVFGLAALGIMFAFLNYHFLASEVFDVKMLVDRNRFVIGEELAGSASQTFIKARTLRELKIGLICEVKSKKKQDETEWDTEIAYEQWFTSHENRDARAFEEVQSEWSVQVPADKEPSTEPDSQSLRLCVWRLEYQAIPTKDRLDYKATFPIIVEAGV